MHTVLTLPASPAVFASLASVLIASFWQGLLLTTAVAVSLRLLPELSATVRSALWTAVLLLVLALALLPLRLASGTATGSGLLHFEGTISLALVALWSCVSAFRAVQLAQNGFRLHGIVRRATPVCVSAQIATLMEGGPRRVRLCTSEEVDRPSVAGFFKPRILLPPALLAGLDESELAQIILHEAEHLRRCDDWINLLQQVSLAVFPLNPALFWLNRRLALERELACDDGVLRSTGARKAYAACLARVAEHSLVRQGVSLALGVLGDWIGHGQRKAELTLRVERILCSPAQGLGRMRSRLAAASLFAGLVGATSLLAHSPQLVSFMPEAPAFASIPAPESLPGMGMLPVRTNVMSHPMLVRAVMPTPISSTMPFRSSTAKNRLHLRAEARRALRQNIGSRVVLAAWRSQAHRQTAGFHATNRVQGVALPAMMPRVLDPQALRVTPVVFQVSSETQGWYAAVPVQGGWLVVQL